MRIQDLLDWTDGPGLNTCMGSARRVDPVQRGLAVKAELTLRVITLISNQEVSSFVKKTQVNA